MADESVSRQGLRPKLDPAEEPCSHRASGEPIASNHEPSGRAKVSLQKRKNGLDRVECIRRCLKCNRSFCSAGVHHRICSLCKRVRHPEDCDSGKSRDCDATRERRDRYLRALMGLSLAKGNPTEIFARAKPRIRTCQWIAGEPSENEACKCGAATCDGSVYCVRHRAAATLGPTGGRPESNGSGRRGA
jgi:hypothetical protein